jgi:hypothetical protein
MLNFLYFVYGIILLFLPIIFWLVGKINGIIAFYWQIIAIVVVCLVWVYIEYKFPYEGGSGKE